MTSPATHKAAVSPTLIVGVIVACAFAAWLLMPSGEMLLDRQVRDGSNARALATLRGLGSVGRCVIVGRGANFILPSETTLRVSMVSPTEDRARVTARRLGLSAQEAADYVETAERQRLAFLQAHFEKDPTNPHHFDLVLNMSRLSVDDAADLIIETLRRLEKRGEPAKPGADVGVTRAGTEVGRVATPALT